MSIWATSKTLLDNAVSLHRDTSLAPWEIPSATAECLEFCSQSQPWLRQHPGVEEAAELCMSIVKLLLGLYSQLGVAQPVWGRTRLPKASQTLKSLGAMLEADLRPREPGKFVWPWPSPLSLPTVKSERQLAPCLARQLVFTACRL